MRWNCCNPLSVSRKDVPVKKPLWNTKHPMWNTWYDEEKMAMMRLLTELVMLAMEDVQFQIKCLQTEQGKEISVHFKSVN
jgi:hypothetical protein